MFFAAKRTHQAVGTVGYRTRSDNTMARRMMMVVATDFFCWVPIIVLGMLSIYGIEISPQVSASLSIQHFPFPVRRFLRQR